METPANTPEQPEICPGCNRFHHLLKADGGTDAVLRTHECVLTRSDAEIEHSRKIITRLRMAKENKGRT